jgi:Rab9 effector protein with kelch motifs
MVLYENKIWVFGGGNGLVGAQQCLDALRDALGTPSPCGCHTANLVQNIMVIISGSDGRECIWCFNLGA